MAFKLTIEEIRRQIESKKISYSELMQEYKKNYDHFKALNVDISSYWDEALEKAKKLDQSFNSSKNMLYGINIAIKDMFLTKNQKTTAASKVLENYVAQYESHVTQKLLDAEYIMSIKTNLDEFAMGSANITSAFGKCINPWILKDRVLRTPGGSSGGSAAAVASYMSLAALGTDTGGSVRQPGGLCGIVGFKPSYGRNSRRGVIAFASSLDHPGIFARNVQDACYVFETIAGNDKYDSTSLDLEVPKLTQVNSDIKGLKIGVCYDLFEKVHPEYKKQLINLVDDLKKQGAIIQDIKIKSQEMALKLYYIIAPAEAASNLARYDGVRYGYKEGKTFEEILNNSRDLFGEEVKRRILIGNFVLSSKEYDKFFGKAVRLRNGVKLEMENLFKDVDTIILPTTPSTAFSLNEERSPLDMYYEDVFTILSNMYGGPAISIPLGLIENLSDKTQDDFGFEFLKTQKGLPVGVQIMGNVLDEANVIKLAKKIEEIVQWKGLEL